MVRDLFFEGWLLTLQSNRCAMDEVLLKVNECSPSAPLPLPSVAVVRTQWPIDPVSAAFSILRNRRLTRQKRLWCHLHGFQMRWNSGPPSDWTFTAPFTTMACLLTP